MSHYLGLGFDSKIKRGTSVKCLSLQKSDVEMMLARFSTSSISFNNDFIQSREATSIDFAAGLKVPVYPCIMVGAKIQYSNFAASTEYTQTFNFLYEIELGNELLKFNRYGEDLLNEVGKKAYSAGAEKFYDICGDKFLAQHKIMASLQLSFKLKYATRSDKEQIGLTITGDLDIFVLSVKLEATLKMLKETSNTDISVEIAAYQRGGKAERLIALLNLPQENNNKYSVVCNTQDEGGINACQGVINNVISYAKVGFIDQFSDIEDTTQFFVPEESMYYMSYSDIGIVFEQEPLYNVNSETISRVVREYSNLVAAKEFIESFIYTLPIERISNSSADNASLKTSFNWNLQMLQESNRVQLKQTLKKISDNMQNIDSQSGLRTCYGNEVCSSNPNLIDLSQVYSLVEKMKKSFFFISQCTPSNSYSRYVIPVSYFDEQKLIYISNSDQWRFYYTIETKDELDMIKVCMLGDTIDIEAMDRECTIFKNLKKDVYIKTYEGELFDLFCQNIGATESEVIYTYITEKAFV